MIFKRPVPLTTLQLKFFDNNASPESEASGINNSFVIGDKNNIIQATDYVGGLIGMNLSFEGDLYIKNCYATVDINGGSYLGGLAGSLMNIDVSNSFATGDVLQTLPTSSGVAGGLVGEAEFLTLTNSSCP